MANDLANLWENFSLNEEEEFELAIPKVELQARVTLGQACVLGKLISEYPYGVVETFTKPLI
jgi:hypothetical protein